MWEDCVFASIILLFLTLSLFMIVYFRSSFLGNRDVPARILLRSHTCKGVRQAELGREEN